MAQRPAAAPGRTRPVSKVALLVRLLALLDEGVWGFEDLKLKLDDEHPPSTRTLRRYLATLGEAGFPWRYDRVTGKYRFQDGYRLRRIELSNDELTGLLALREIASSLGGDLSETIDDLTRKVVGKRDVRRSFSRQAGAAPSDR